MTVQINVGPRIFMFSSMEDWIAHGQGLYQHEKASIQNSVAITTDGRICMSGRDFRLAQERGAYPVTVYWIAQE